MSDGLPHCIAFVGGVLPDEVGFGQPAFNVAGNRFQLGLLTGLAQCSAGPVSVFSVRPEPAFPAGRRLYVRRHEYRVRVGEEPAGAQALALEMLPFVNISGLKEATLFASAFRELVKWSRSARPAPRTIIVFNVFTPLATAVLAAARATGAQAVAVVADLPHGLYRFEGLRGVVERADYAVQKRLLARFDGLVPLTPFIAGDFAPRTPALVMEGGIEPADVDLSPPPPVEPLTCMFSGTLFDVNGVDRLLAAIRLVDEPRARFRFYGAGPLEDAVRAAAASDPRVEHCGLVPNHEVRARQRAAAVLINSRIVEGAITRYTFPSKLIEYMSSGRPVLTTPLPGIPDGYRQHVMMLDGDSAADMAAGIRRAFATDAATLAAVGRAGRDFVLREKSWSRQAERVSDFVRQLADGTLSVIRP
jgi:glycosyltransferase involved in cell wall biosynthesis